MKKIYLLKLFLLVLIDFLLIYLSIKDYPYYNGFPIFLFIFLFISLTYTLKDFRDLLKIFKDHKILETNTDIKKNVLVITWTGFIAFLLLCILILIFGEKEDVDMGIFFLIGLLVSSYYLIIIYLRKKINRIES